MPPNPPITIGPFDNVPAVGSSVASDWAQDITTFVTGVQTLDQLTATTRIDTPDLQASTKIVTPLVQAGAVTVSGAISAADAALTHVGATTIDAINLNLNGLAIIAVPGTDPYINFGATTLWTDAVVCGPSTGGPGSAVMNRDGDISSISPVIDVASLRLQRTPPADAVGQHFVLFGVTSLIGSITINGTGNGVLYQTSSDYRLKDDLGPIVNALERLGALRPRHIAWKSNGAEEDTFFAHELDEVVPSAVTGVKDAVDDNGDIIPQQLDPSRVVPLLVASIQELVARVAVLEAG